MLTRTAAPSSTGCRRFRPRADRRAAQLARMPAGSKQRLHCQSYQPWRLRAHLDGAAAPALRRQTRPVAALDYWGGTGVRGFIGREVFNAVLIDRKTATPGRMRSPWSKMPWALAPRSSFFRRHAQHHRRGAAAVQERAVSGSPRRGPTSRSCRCGSTTSRASCPRANSCRCRCCAA